MLMRLEGNKVRLDVYEDYIEFVGTKAMSLLGKNGTNRLYVNQITGIQYINATAASNGWLHFSVPGAQDMLQNIHGAIRNRNAIVFSKSENTQAGLIKSKIEELISNPASLSTVGKDYTAELVSLKHLLDVGILTQDEFDKKKQQVLGV